MHVNPVCDMSIIKALFSIDDMWERFAEGDSDYDPDWIEATDAEEYASFEALGVPVGVLKMDNLSESCLGIHPYLIPQARQLHRDMVLSMYRFLTWYRPEVKDLIISIPSCFDRVAKYSKKFGFETFFVEKSSYFKHGKYHDINHMINRNWKVA